VTLLQRSSAFVQGTTELSALRKAAHQVQAVDTRANQLEKELAKLQLALGRRRLLISQGLTVTADLSSAGGVAHYLKTFKEAIATDPASATAADFAPKTIAPIGLLSSEVELACKQAWEFNVRSLAPQVGDLLQHLMQVSSLRDRVDFVRKRRDDLLALANTLPTGTREFDRAKQLADDCSVAWQSLDLGSVPAEVTKFLRDAGRPQGADLERLDTTVKDWLVAHGLLASFGVRAR
jgi:hypothetical protein